MFMMSSFSINMYANMSVIQNNANLKSAVVKS